MTKTMTLDEFKELIEDPRWEHTAKIEVVEEIPQEHDDFDEEGERIPKTIYKGWGYGTCTSKLEDMTITYQESFTYIKYDIDSLEQDTDGPTDGWTTEGFEVLDDEEDVIEAAQLGEILSYEFSAVDYSELNLDETIDLDYSEDSDMETFTLEIDNKPSLRFNGEKVASTRSYADNAAGSGYSGSTGRWEELYLYKTAGGKYVCHKIERTQWQKERDAYTGKVCDTIEEVKDFFGHGWLAKDLYAEAKIENVTEIS